VKWCSAKLLKERSGASTAALVFIKSYAVQAPTKYQLLMTIKSEVLQYK
jgi:hypothetical protein